MSADPTKDRDQNRDGRQRPAEHRRPDDHEPPVRTKAADQAIRVRFLTLGLGSSARHAVRRRQRPNQRDRQVRAGGGKWVKERSVEVPAVTGVTANDVSGIVTIYATTSGSPGKAAALQDRRRSGCRRHPQRRAEEIGKAPANEAWRGVAFAPGTTIGSGGTPPKLPAPHIGDGETACRRRSATPPTRRSAITVSDSPFAANELTVTVASSNDRRAVCAITSPAAAANGR